ncbi:MAG: molybdopterin-synthase adenylyltransferase MoeB [Pseudomonadales bacterium]|nr:molybdopterin-synthase adenylyltransferase MoeB [Pseudomonadales bacterium]
MMNDDQLLRYSRHILLQDIDVDGQQMLLDSTVLIVGLGGLGSPVSMYLAASGVGRMLIADDDTVEMSNLQRQVLYDTQAIGLKKTEAAARVLRAMNPDVDIIEVTERLDSASLARYVEQSDIVVDCSDNFVTRFQVNAACVVARKPLVSAAAIRWEGQVAVFDTSRGGACYQCLYQNLEEENETCSNSGVFSPLLGVIGSLQAAEVLKCLLGKGKTLVDGLLIVDVLTLDIRRLSLKKDSCCPVCSEARI